MYVSGINRYAATIILSNIILSFYQERRRLQVHAPYEQEQPCFSYYQSYRTKTYSY